MVSSKEVRTRGVWDKYDSEDNSVGGSQEGTL